MFMLNLPWSKIITGKEKDRAYRKKNKM